MINQAVAKISRAVDPDKEMRKRIADAELNPSIDNKIALARECIASSMPAEAAKLFRSCLTGAFARDPNLKFGLLEAEFAAGDHERAKSTAEGLLKEMLKALGQGDRAQALFRELLGNAERSPRFYQDAQSEWIRAAKRELGA